jgi:hypothetical protein
MEHSTNAQQHSQNARQSSDEVAASKIGFAKLSPGNAMPRLSRRCRKEGCWRRQFAEFRNPDTLEPMLKNSAEHGLGRRCLQLAPT